MSPATNHQEQLLRDVVRLLRHPVQSSGVVPCADGWCCIANVVDAINSAPGRHWLPTSIKLLREAVLDEPNERFELNGTKVRALYGHSWSHVLMGRIANPPSVLYHGSRLSHLARILATGLHPRTRTKLHLSSNLCYAAKVAATHPDPVVLSINGLALAPQITLRQANSHVWLSDKIGPEFLRLDPERCSVLRCRYHAANRRVDDDEDSTETEHRDRCG